MSIFGKVAGICGQSKLWKREEGVFSSKPMNIGSFQKKYLFIASSD